MDGFGLKFPDRPIACLNTKCFWNENKFCLGTIANLDENGRCIIQDWQDRYEKEGKENGSKEHNSEVCKA